MFLVHVAGIRIMYAPGPEGNAEAPVGSPGGSTGFDVGVTVLGGTVPASLLCRSHEGQLGASSFHVPSNDR